MAHFKYSQVAHEKLRAKVRFKSYQMGLTLQGKKCLGRMVSIIVRVWPYDKPKKICETS